MKKRDSRVEPEGENKQGKHNERGGNRENCFFKHFFKKMHK